MLGLHDIQLRMALAGRRGRDISSDSGSGMTSRHASSDADAADRVFFQRQDLRRSIGIGMMLLLAIAIVHR